MNQPDCYQKRFGHNYVGGKCLKCEGLQNPLKEIKIQESFIELHPSIHSELHELVDKTRSQFGETATKGKGSFSFYLGFFKKLGKDTVYKILAELKETKKEREVKLFWWKVRKELQSRIDKNKIIKSVN